MKPLSKFKRVISILFITTLAAMPVLANAADAPERIAADTPKTTVAGNTFVAPAGWSLVVKGPATILEAPEGGSFIAIIDVPAKDAKTGDDALAIAWKAYKPDAKWPLKVASPIADKDGWTERKGYDYQTSPNEKRGVGADVRKANDVWTVTIADVADAVGEKRGAQIALIYGKLLPKGMTRESFAGKKAHDLDAARLAELRTFVNTSLTLTGVPGVSVGVYQNGKMVMAEGFGVRELGKPAKVDADTKYMIASNTKAMTTLMLAKLVDAKKLAWDTPAASVFPEFHLGDPEITKQVLVKHLICACTGMPRQDLEWLLEFSGLTPDKMMDVLGTMNPTSKFGD